MNETNVFLPFLFSLPPVLVVVLAILLGWLIGWLPPTARAVRRNRENRRLRQRVAELEKWDPQQPTGDRETPVIPDRSPSEARLQEPYAEHENL